MNLCQQFYLLIKSASTRLPEDVCDALYLARQRETTDGAATAALDTILKNTELASKLQRPLCQDTGTIAFYIRLNKELQTPRLCNSLETAARSAVKQATDDCLLRQNCIDSITGKNTGNNLGYVNPVFHWIDDESCKEPVCTIMLKGGGSENMSCQYSLPDARIHAARDLDGVRRCALDAVTRIQGQGCAPGILGICIGGDRAGGYEEAKLQLLRKIGERHTTPELAELENKIVEESNSLGIGAMGLGGNVTILDAFIGSRTRHPASFFVTIAYMCWCCRRQTAQIHTSELD